MMLFAQLRTQVTPSARLDMIPMAAVSRPAPLLFCERFLVSLRDSDEPVNSAVVERAISFLRAAYAQRTSLKPPTIGQGDGGVVGMTWTSQQDHITVEFFPDDHIEFFHENRNTHALLDAVLHKDLKLADAIARITAVR
jgi:hypothetical protein